MEPTVTSLPVVEILREMAAGVPDVQQRLDREWLEAIEQTANIFRQPGIAGLDTLARSIAPSRLVWQDILLEIQMAIQKSRASAFTLNVRPLNVSYYRRYGASSYSAVRLQVAVRQVPAPQQIK